MEDAKELRQMPEIQSIAAYLRGMTFRKKTFGGFDIESVYEHFSAVTQMYEAIICAYMEQVDRYARQLAELESRHKREEEQVPAAWQPEQPQWYDASGMQPQPMQQPYMDQNPWAPDPWAVYPSAPWAQQPAPPQAYYAPQQAYAWPNEPEGLPDPAFLYAQG